LKLAIRTSLRFADIATRGFPNSAFTSSIGFWNVFALVTLKLLLAGRTLSLSEKAQLSRSFDFYSFIPATFPTDCDYSVISNLPYGIG
jgi:hypothetical protein